MKIHLWLHWLVLVIGTIEQFTTEAYHHISDNIHIKPAIMSKIDLTKVYKALYTAKSTPMLINVPPGHYIAINGKGDPNKEKFAESTQALYTAAYGIKGIYKQSAQDFVVSKLEGLWWVTAEGDPLKVPKEEWYWQLLIRMPDYVTNSVVQQALQQTFTKKQLPLLKEISLISLAEGKSVQIMHIGPFATEPATLRLMEEFMEAGGLKWNGRHHEIYLSDPRKTAPDKMKTILRQPVK
jgi:hypothetical protein